MSFMIAFLITSSAQASAPPATAPEPRWLSCTALETQQGTVIVDRLAFVMFETASTSITPQSAAMLDGFVREYNAPPYCEIIISGHADRVGAAGYNLSLSKRRADAVSAYLRRKGLTARMVIEWHGETKPMVETKDGVAERQNRYVIVGVSDWPTGH